MKGCNILICGVGGQGNLLLEKILGSSALKEGHTVRSADTFGAAQRGGSVLSHFRIGDGFSASLVPKGDCDVIIGFEPLETLRVAVNYLRKDGLVIYNTTPIPTARVNAGDDVYPSLDKICALLESLTSNLVSFNATQMALETAGTSRATNMVLCGVAMGLSFLPIKPDAIQDEITRRTKLLAEANLKAFKAGMEFGHTIKTKNFTFELSN